ncbi:MAG TPA: hypothetical protein VFO29_09770 [Candidatus Rubrimentiphilum sp.]|nr:hypothetical protein [Candidatus Rubrimentiphilum sp.]
MFAIRELAFSLVILHAVWALAYVLGSMALAPFGEERDEDVTAGRALLDLVISSACGLAVLALGAFFLALFSIFYAPALVLLLVLGAAFSSIRRRGAFTAAFWRQRWLVLRKSVTPYTVATWALAIGLGIPAVLPDSSYDTQAFLLPQALDWAQAHALSVDATLRFPYYAQNWVLLQAWFFAFNLGDYTNLLTWLCTILTALGIQSLIAGFAPQTAHDGSRQALFARLTFYAAVFTAPLAFLLSPITIRWEWTSMQDIAQGFIFLAFMLCAVAALRARDSFRPLAAAIIIAAFFAGIKTSLIAFLPLYALVIAAICVRQRYGARTLALALAALVALSSPWYIRSFVLDGDPLAPVLNLKFHGVDKKFSSYDLAGIDSDLRLAQSVRPADLLTVPWRIAFQTDTITFREYGVTLGYLFLYLPALVLLMSLYKTGRRWLDAESILMAAIIASGIFYWLGTSYMARYSLLFDSAFIAFYAYLVLRMTKRPRWGFLAATAVFIALAIPSSAEGYNFLSSQLRAYNLHYRDVYTSRESFLNARYGESYRNEIRSLIDFEKRDDSAKRIYSVGLMEWRFSFRREGIALIGDWVGPERFNDLDAMIHLGRFKEYARRFGFDAMIVPLDTKILSPRTILHLEEQARAAGFKTVRPPGSTHALLLRS